MQPIRACVAGFSCSRAAWVVVAALAVGLFVAAIPAELALLRVPCPTPVCITRQLPPAGLRSMEDLGLSLGSFAAYTVAMDFLFLSPKTVRNHVSNILHKLQVADRTEAIIRAREAGLGAKGGSS